MFRLLRTSILILAVIISSVGIAPLAPRQAFAAATTWYVATTGNDANSCSSPAQPCKSIQAAVDKAGSGDTVRVAIGSYFGLQSAVINLSPANKNLTISGGWNANYSGQLGLSTLDGQEKIGGIAINLCGVGGSSLIKLQNLIIIRGYTGGSGGISIPCSGPNVEISNSVIMKNIGGDPNLSGGGGGGGLYNAGIITITNSSIISNSIVGSFQGSGIVNLGKVTLINTTISSNVGAESIYNLFSVLKIENSTIYDNPDGGIHNVGGTVEYRNSIVAKNGIDCINNINYSGNTTSLKYNIIQSNYSCSVDPSDVTNSEPFIKPLKNYGGLTPTHALAPNSPAINAGDPNGCGTSLGINGFDQRGAPRVGRCDIGAYEANLGVSKSVTGNFAPNGVVSYSVQLSSVNGQNLSNVLVTDTLPITLTYVGGSASANQGTVSVVNNTILWSGTVFTSSPTNIVYSAQNNSPNWGEVITNTVVGNWSGFLSDANASFDTFARLYLPLTSRNYCPNFTDDFSQPRGWFTIDSNLRRVELLNGEYRSLSKQSGYLFLYRAPTCSRENYSVEVDARWAQTGSDLGLIFGDNGDYSNFYFFDINTDFQAFILLRYSGGAYTTLAGPTQTSVINPGTQNNTLKVIRNGTAISLYANNILLGTWYDGAIAGLTYVGLATSPYDDVPVSDARFDNFSVASLGISGGASLPSLEPPSVTATSRPLPANINWQPQLNLKVVEQP